MAAELGTMRVTEQIDALYTLATNPMKYLVVPRFLASTIMMFFLTALGMYVGIAGGYFVGVKVLGTNPVTYINQSINNTEVTDIWYGLIKSLVFGAVVGLIGCYKGSTPRAEPRAWEGHDRRGRGVVHADPDPGLFPVRAVVVSPWR